MKNRHKLLTLLALLATTAGWGCGWFDDPTPEYIRIQVAGPAGSQAAVAYTSQFVAGVDDQGVTRVQVLWADTVIHTLPVDTTIYIGVDRRFFTEVTPVSADTLSLRVRIDVDDRIQVDETGLVIRTSPFRYAYLFNHQLTRIIDVVL